MLEIDGAHEASIAELVRHYRALDRWEDVTALYERQLKLVTQTEQRVEILLSLGRVLRRADRLAGARDRELRARARDRSRTRGRARGAGSPARIRGRRRRRAQGDRGAGGQGDARARPRPSSTCAPPSCSKGAAIATAPSNATSWRSTPTPKTSAAALALRVGISGARRRQRRDPASRSRDSADRGRPRQGQARRRDGDARPRSAQGRQARQGGRGARADLRPDEPRRADDPRRPRVRRQALPRSRTSTTRCWPSAPTRSTRREAARILVRYVDALSQTGSTEKALAPMDTLLRIAPDDLEALERVAYVTFEHGSPKRAVELYADILERFNDKLQGAQRAGIAYRYGEALRRSENLEAALGPSRGVGRSRSLEPGAAGGAGQDPRGARATGSEVDQDQDAPPRSWPTATSASSCWSRSATSPRPS